MNKKFANKRSPTYVKNSKKGNHQAIVEVATIYEDDESWKYNLYCAKEFAKRGWLALGWPPEYDGKGDM